MLTRGTVQHAYTPTLKLHEISPGYVREVTVNRVTHTWAISRPVSAPEVGQIGPMNTIESQTPYRPIIRGGGLGMSMPQPHLEADLSNPMTWQRPYRKDSR